MAHDRKSSCPPALAPSQPQIGWDNQCLRTAMQGPVHLHTSTLKEENKFHSTTPASPSNTRLAPICLKRQAPRVTDFLEGKWQPASSETDFQEACASLTADPLPDSIPAAMVSRTSQGSFPAVPSTLELTSPLKGTNSHVA